MECNMDRDILQLSGLQHFAFCPRQWALIHIEQQWRENERTADGRIFHTRAHGGEEHERRGDLLILRGLRVHSEKLGISGVCDVVEFHKDINGVKLSSYDGLWSPYPVEYKNGEPKSNNADRVQLCAQAMCLEEMLLCSIAEGSLFYGKTRRREIVKVDDALRSETLSLLEQMHSYYRHNRTPKAKQTKSCSACSLRDICLPRLPKLEKVSTYIRSYMEEGT
ncbi:MAG: CRISPR-associated protein Cas4 [Clostridia bacterium]|nr:CRISPR-associated protein Cas4 [Clostridia bacterium]